MEDSDITPPQVPTSGRAAPSASAAPAASPMAPSGATVPGSTPSANPAAAQGSLPASGYYWKLLELHNSNRIDYNTRKWETVKFFHGAAFLLLTASLAAVVAAARDSKLDHPLVRLFLSALLIIVFVSALYGRRNIERESRLLFIEEYQMFKMAKLLGLDITLPANERWLPTDEHVLPEKWRKWNYGIASKQTATLEDLATARVQNHEFANLFGDIFIVEAIVAVLLGAALWIL